MVEIRPVSIKCHNLHSFKEGMILFSQGYPSSETNIKFIWLSSLYYLFQKFPTLSLTFQQAFTNFL